MILAPLMAPIVSLAMGLARADQALLVQSARTLGGGILVVLGVALAVSQLLPLEHLNAQMSARTTPNLLDLVVALFSGIAGAYATANEQVARSVAGVAIAVALVPPLSVSGIGLGWGEFGIFLSAGLLFVTNLFGIAFGAALTFWVMGYAPLQRAGRGMVAVLVLLALVSIPLSLGLQSMLERERILQRLDAVPAELFASAGLSLREVRVQPGPPPRVMLQLESRSAPEAQRMRQVRERLLERLGRAPMDLRIGVQLVY
jgi:uncharacterized hydrophobic protein (TIGR00271 family)